MLDLTIGFDMGYLNARPHPHPSISTFVSGQGNKKKNEPPNLLLLLSDKVKLPSEQIL